MALVAKNTGGDYKPPPAGTHIGICYMVVDIGTHLPPAFGDKPPKPTRQLVIGFELPQELMDEGRPYAVSNFYTLSLHEKANLRKDLETWRGRAFTQQELDGFDIRRVLGVPCLLSIVHETKQDGSVRANIGGVMATPKGTAPVKQINPSVSFDIDEWNQPVFDALPEWLQKKILSSDEGKARGGSPTPKTGGALDSETVTLEDGTVIDYTDPRHPDYIAF